MNVKEFYSNIDGNYDDFLKRVSGNETFILKWVKLFLNDPSYRALEAAMDCGDYSEVFKSAHTLKGVCANLSFLKLCDNSGAIVNYLRETEGQPDDRYIKQLFDKVEVEYKNVIGLIGEIE